MEEDEFSPNDEQAIRDRIDDELVNHEDASRPYPQAAIAAKSPISYFAPGSEDIDLK
jgi:hypothetical protein